MKKKILIKISGIFIAAFIIVILNGMIINNLLKNKINSFITFIASHDIEPRTKITENDITEIEITDLNLITNTFTKKDDIVGKYTDIQGRIPAGSFFFESMLKKEEEIPDYAALQLKEGQTSFSFTQDIDKLNSLIEGQRVDVYFENDEISGLLISHARIIAIRDKNGYSITNVVSAV